MCEAMCLTSVFTPETCSLDVRSLGLPCSLLLPFTPVPGPLGSRVSNGRGRAEGWEVGRALVRNGGPEDNELPSLLQTLVT